MGRPAWLKVKLPGHGRYREVRRLVSKLRVQTVCDHARCPNAAECWGGGTATFMILGEICTRGCRFCAVTSGRPAGAPDPGEPHRVAEAARLLGLRHVVLTSVDRDDLEDGGAAHFASTVAAIRARCPEATVEVLTPDFGARPEALRVVVHAGAHVLGHNVETTRELTSAVRDPRCSYERSLAVLRQYRELDPQAVIKSSLLLGLGEDEPQVVQTLRDLHAAGVEWVTLGQYLQPTRRHLPVRRYVPPQEFEALAARAREIGFLLVTAGPLVRSSYRAAEDHALARIRAQRPGR